MIDDELALLFRTELCNVIRSEHSGHELSHAASRTIERFGEDAKIDARSRNAANLFRQTHEGKAEIAISVLNLIRHTVMHFIHFLHGFIGEVCRSKFFDAVDHQLLIFTKTKIHSFLLLLA